MKEYKPRYLRCKHCNFQGVSRLSLQVHMGKMHNKTKSQLLMEIANKVEALLSLYGLEDRFLSNIKKMYKKRVIERR